MQKIVLIACASKKKDTPAAAKDIYQSSLFKKNLRYAEMLNPDEIFILSAKYGLLQLDKQIEPYDKSLNDMRENDKEEWAEGVKEQLKNYADLKNDHFIILAGNNYRKYLIPELENCEMPLEGLGIGKQLAYLTDKVEIGEKCKMLHRYLRKRRRYSFPFVKEEIPRNGIYVLFEKGEEGHNGERIVRIGTHRGDGQLPSRLNQHFIKENKDRSIFRKNIGRCFLNRVSDPFLEKWDLDLTSRKSREKHSDKVDFQYQDRIENMVTGYIQGVFTFSVIEVPEKEKRLFWESRLVSTVSLCDSCRPSANWFGSFSPKRKIREGGLWQEQELYKEAFSDGELEEFMGA